MPEISQADLDILQQSRKLLNEVYDSPEHGLAVKRAIKAVRPGQPIPELDALSAAAPALAQVDTLSAAVAKLSEDLSNDKLERRQAADADNLARRMARARDRYGLTEDGVAGMTDLMREKGIVDPDDAAELYVARQPKPALASQRQGRFGQGSYLDVTGFADQAEKQNLLLTNSDRFLVNEVEAFLAEEGITA